MTPDRVIELLLGAIVTLLGGGKVVEIVANRLKTRAEARKASAEAEKTEAEIDDVAARNAIDLYIQSNTWLQDRLKKLDDEVTALEQRAEEAERARNEMARRYDELKRWVSNAFDTLIYELGRGDSPTIDRAMVIETIKRVKATKPATGPLGAQP